MGRRDIGSIPACTGEPVNSSCEGISTRVYPRVYGGTAATISWHQSQRGLSPRVRGNPPACILYMPSWGSIPACTGEPVAFDGALAAVKVYPRVYGGTRAFLPFRSLSIGLSPRVRGNPVPEVAGYVLDGSIPACTGEPIC